MKNPATLPFFLLIANWRYLFAQAFEGSNLSPRTLFSFQIIFLFLHKTKIEEETLKEPYSIGYEL